MVHFKSLPLIWQALSFFEKLLIIGGAVTILLLLFLCVYYLAKRFY
ncbi:hypothetical protein [Ethanoligenens harbinense]|uniref:Uncharacterized protein n=1 Tax=Ethanoligenens harbinense (strain DSM 18485 / JCM 12961 / CGMCC 1.5033 / YUAN-3) TaxID=663278 RepID=E6U710_ETHHY|nr:hypothetical protein [Ethanoligenens harbinense]ADU28080.1 hypothetical protein Ethha_2587 [Ethanoligenens harbinense YUAN-3]